MDKVIPLTPGQNAGPIGLGFRAYSLMIDNPTAQWWYIPQTNRYVPPYVLGLRLTLDGTEALTILAQTPTSFTSSVITGEAGRATANEDRGSELSGVSSTQRPFYYDRNAVVKTVSYAAQLAPHAATNRIFYITPVDKLTMIDVLTCQMERAAVAGAASRARIQYAYLPFNGGAVLLTDCISYSNALGPMDRLLVASLGIMNPSDDYAIATEDLSTGGSVNYSTGLKLFEFNR